MNPCKTCAWWELTSHADDYGYGLCNHDKILVKLLAFSVPLSSNGVTTFNPEDDLLTGRDFGCIHHEQKEENAV